MAALQPDVDPNQPDTDEADSWPILRRCVPAEQTTTPKVLKCRSVFDLAAAEDAAELLRKLARFGDASADAPPCLAAGRTGKPLVKRLPGVVVCAGPRYPSDRWTTERQAYEEARRAKQRPPRTKGGFRRAKGKKLIALVGPDG